MPRKVREIMKAKQLAKRTKSQQRKLKRLENPYKKESEEGTKRPLKPVPEFVQKKGESDQAFLNRVDRETAQVIAKSKFETKYNVDLDNQGGENKDSDVPKKKKKRSERKKQRLKEKLEKLKFKKTKTKTEKKATGFEDLKDDIQFGEVAMQPPSLTSMPRKAQQTENKPGRKSLLLKNLIDHSVTGKSTTNERKVGQTIKRKHLSIAEKRKIDSEREKAIELYRSIKEKKIAASQYMP